MHYITQDYIYNIEAKKAIFRMFGYDFVHVNFRKGLTDLIVVSIADIIVSFT